MWISIPTEESINLDAMTFASLAGFVSSSTFGSYLVAVAAIQELMNTILSPLNQPLLQHLSVNPAILGAISKMIIAVSNICKWARA